MTMRGTPYYYNGDELGMTNIRFINIEDYRDVQTLNAYQHAKRTGADLNKLIKRLAFSARDNSRTPFQWDTTSNAGFTTGTPWIKVNPNYKAINELTEEKDPNSVLNYFRKAVKLRKENLALVYGKYTLLDRDNPNVYVYTRELNGKKFLVLLNFRSTSSLYNIGIDVSKEKLLLDNYRNASTGNKLRPYEAAVYEL
jgi:oligo-1,6-glucosidase